MHQGDVTDEAPTPRCLYDAISEEGRLSDLYTSWLGFLRKLNGAEGNTKVSPAFRGTARRSKFRDTQLASWAHLRHNTIPYAKQSFTGGITCSFPKAYVEPYPGFFAAEAARSAQGLRASEANLYHSRLSGPW